jgi:hypothetical protein
LPNERLERETIIAIRVTGGDSVGARKLLTR